MAVYYARQHSNADVGDIVVDWGQQLLRCSALEAINDPYGWFDYLSRLLGLVLFSSDDRSLILEEKALVIQCVHGSSHISIEQKHFKEGELIEASEKFYLVAVCVVAAVTFNGTTEPCALQLSPVHARHGGMGSEISAVNASAARKTHIRHHVHHRAGVDDDVGGELHDETNAERHVHDLLQHRQPHAAVDLGPRRGAWIFMLVVSYVGTPAVLLAVHFILERRNAEWEVWITECSEKERDAGRVEQYDEDGPVVTKSADIALLDLTDLEKRIIYILVIDSLLST
ncbi:hypothetical protein F5Y05DRAFT_420031 [Hypoxylon sp. FL0543]|nr:hypothetical protein F5Y05DRAFT_420031 [Hypoxylon sp. FL0543]